MFNSGSNSRLGNGSVQSNYSSSGLSSQCLVGSSNISEIGSDGGDVDLSNICLSQVLGLIRNRDCLRSCKGLAELADVDIGVSILAGEASESDFVVSVLRDPVNDGCHSYGNAADGEGTGGGQAGV